MGSKERALPVFTFHDAILYLSITWVIVTNEHIPEILLIWLVNEKKLYWYCISSCGEIVMDVNAIWNDLKGISLLFFSQFNALLQWATLYPINGTCQFIVLYCKHFQAVEVGWDGGYNPPVTSFNLTSVRWK